MTLTTRLLVPQSVDTVSVPPLNQRPERSVKPIQPSCADGIASTEEIQMEESNSPQDNAEFGLLGPVPRG